ncbi:MAG: transcriptional regulator [Phycisphaerales bacterium]|nr:transcriptional regulator [Phycisphaerales bacterium]
MATPLKILPAAAREAFVKTRTDHAKETFEDYVEAVEEISARTGACRVRDLAVCMRVSHVTVVRIVRRVTRAGLATKERHGPIALTLSGTRMARASRERHATVLEFLRSLGVPAVDAARDAEGIEHHAGPRTLAAMRRHLARQRA